MRPPSPSYILSRSIYVIILIVVGLTVSSYYKKNRRQAAIIEELKDLTADNSFYRQFYAAEARKSLVKGVGLIMEANSLGIPPDDALSRCMGTKRGLFDSDASRDDPPVRQKIVRDCLRGNYVNLIKLGFKADTPTLTALRSGELPGIPTGPHAGQRPALAYLIDPAFSPGLDKVIANLEIRPPSEGETKPTDIEIASARHLLRDLMEASVIEEAAYDRIMDQLYGRRPADPASSGKNPQSKPAPTPPSPVPEPPKPTPEPPKP